jgi:hypothetical protein
MSYSHNQSLFINNEKLYNHQISLLKMINLIEKYYKQNKYYNLEICFLIDLSGSMRPYLSYIRHNISILIEQFQNKTKNKTLFCCLGYRENKNINSNHQLLYLKWTNKLNYLLEFLKDENAFGGGDLQEDIIYPLNEIKKFTKWNKSISNFKLIIHLTDSKPKYNNQLKDIIQSILNYNLIYFLIPLKYDALHIAKENKNIIIINSNNFKPIKKSKKKVSFSKINIVHYLK